MTNKKTNIRSIRFSDEMAELINQQAGESFTAKFENLITKCVWERPEAERKIRTLEEEIAIKQRQLMALREKHLQLRDDLVEIEMKMEALDRVITKALEHSDKM